MRLGEQKFPKPIMGFVGFFCSLFLLQNFLKKLKKLFKSTDEPGTFDEIIELQKGGEIVTALERRDKIIEILCEKRTVTLNYLSDEFKVAKSTIQNDILELSLSYPIFSKSGIGGGIYIAKGYYRDKDYLSSKQKETLESLLGEIDEERRNVLESILEKFARPTA